MAGTIIDRPLSRPRACRVRFELATEKDDAEIRRLLREHPLPGPIALAAEREPDYFADAGLADEEKQTIVAREAGRLACVGSCAVRLRFINDQPRRVGYLGGLRLDRHSSGRFDILRRGYQFFQQLQGGKPADFYFTSIAADNERARNFLERGLPGMPAYKFLCQFTTLLLPVPSSARAQQKLSRRAQERLVSEGVSIVSESSEYLAELISCLNEHGRPSQLTAFWTEDTLRSLNKLGLAPADFQLVRNGHQAAASAALWDQRGFKQVTIRGYSRGLSLARPWINLAAQWLGTPQLPPINSALPFALLSPLAVPLEKPQSLLALVELNLALAARRRLKFLALGLAAGDARLETIRSHFRGREYHTRLYQVKWDDSTAEDIVLDGRPILPEVAWL
jgi:hypothetical protein